MKYYRTILLLIALLVIPTSVSALITNNTANDNYYSSNTTLISGSFIHDENYTPREIVILILIIGILFWLVSIAAPVCQDLFAIAAPVWLGVATWQAGYMTKEDIAIVVSGNTIYSVHTEIISPDPVMQILCFILTILSVLSAVYVIFLAKTEDNPKPKQTDTSKL